jgi:4-hydroxybenzoate polyprenyltransferase
VPLSVTLVVLLLDGRALSPAALAVLALVVVAVCAVGNYGYALNDLYDVEEDARAGRANSAAAAGAVRMWLIITLSALCAEIAAWIAARTTGALITLAELALPATYSIPPLRTKERLWLGVASDALAAHVYPAVLALLAVSHWSLRPVSWLLACSAVVWSLAAGLRGILSHQLHTAQRDAGAGLATVVHAAGALALERFIVLVLLPLEVAGFGALLIASDAGPVLWTGGALYLAYEAYKTHDGGTFRVAAFRAQGQRYVPFVEESFYKAWAPLLIAFDAARVDLRYLVVPAAYALLFWPHLVVEARRLGAVMSSLRRPRATAGADRSNAGS